MIGITDDQGAMCFLGLVLAIKSHRCFDCFLPIIGDTDDRCISKPSLVSKFVTRIS